MLSEIRDTLLREYHVWLHLDDFIAELLYVLLLQFQNLGKVLLFHHLDVRLRGRRAADEPVTRGAWLITFRSD